MDSDSKSTKSEEDSSTKYVLDYYRKFSQNKDLPKYFSGTSISYLPEIRDDVENEPQDIIIKTDVDIVITADEGKQDDHGDSSPTSSIKSNRKLEWDNGADIGYHNCLITKKIHKSYSLPILSDLKTRQVAFEFAQPSTSSRTPKSESSGGSNVKLVVIPCSSSSEGNSVEMKHYSSSSSVSDSKKGNVITSTSSKNESSEKVDTPSSSSSTSQKISSFKSTLSHLKKKIGLPDAQSTPNSLEEITSGSGNILNTPVIKNHEKPVKVLVLDEKCAKSTDSEIEDDKVKVEEAPDNALPIEYVNEPSKTVENDCEQNLGINNKSKPTKKVVNLCLTNPLSIECLSIPPEPKKQSVQTSAEYLTVSVQTDHISEKELIKIIASQQNLNQSLLFLGHQENGANDGSTQTTSEIEATSKCDSFEFMKPNSARTSAESEKGEGPSTKSSGSRESSSGNVHLAEAVSTENIGNDIEKSVYILQKLLKSKKYDAATKKRYVKRILKKITDSKYFEESSASSELFFPKKSSRTEVSKVSLKIAKSTDSSGERSQQPGTAQRRFSREGKPQSSPRKKVCSQEFAKDERSSPPEIIPVKSRDTRKNLFTLTNNEFSVGRYQDQALKALESRKPQTLGTNDDTSLEKQFDSSSTSRSYHNWKEDRTVSEKKYILNGHGDCIEREYQINWIDREINHLAKLKSLLEKPIESTPAENTKSTTSTYAVSTKSDQAAKTDNGSKRKFVIETKLGAGSSKQRNFKLDGKKYSVENFTEVETGVEEPGQVQADIEVISTDTTTNIIVTTLCEVCKSRHCVCADESSGSFKRDSTKDNVCHKCGKYSCSCGSLSNVKSTETSNFSSMGAISNKCISCKSYPCVCSVCLKQSSAVRDGYSAVVPKLDLREGSENELFSCRSQLSSKSSAICARCRKCPCLCVKPQKDSAGTSEGEKISEPSSETSSGSLSRVFQNCNCNAKSKCNCGFVEKLLRHFNKEDLFRDLNFEDISVQTEPERHIDTNSIGLQMQVDTRNQNLQTSKREETKASQTIIKHQQRQVQTTAEEFFDLPKVEKMSWHRAEMPAATSKERTMTKGDPVKEVSNKDNEVSTYQDVSAQTLGQVEDRQSQTLEDMYQNITSIAVGTDKVPVRSFRVQAISQEDAITQSVLQMSTDNKTRDSVTSYDETKFVERVDKKTRTTEVQTDIKPLCVCARTQTEDGHQIRTKSDSSSGESSKKITFVCSDPRCEKFHRKDGEDDVKGNSRSRTHDVGTYKTNSHDTGTYDAATQDGRSLEIGPTYLEEGFGTGTQGTYKRSWQELSGPREVQTEKQGIDFGVGITSKDGVCVCGFIKKVHSRDEAEKEWKSPQMDNTNSSAGNGTSKVASTLSSTNGTTPSDSITTQSDTSSLQICVCCKRRTPTENMSMLRSNNNDFPLCRRCVRKKPILTSVCYTGPEHVCACSSPDGGKAVADGFCRVGEYCSCTKPSRMQNSRYCSHCQFKLRRTQRSKNGIAYTLTLEDESPRKLEKQKKKTKKLEEIRMKVPCPSNRKRHKEKENLNRREVRKYNQHEEPERDNAENGRSDHREEKREGRVAGKDRQKMKNKDNLTLQEYLRRNRPDFIDSAEFRRQAVVNSQTERQLTKDELKLKFIQENEQNTILRVPNKLFSEKEMREITRRNYKKLPEVQQRLNNFREQRLRNADKFIVDMFKRKIQGSVLKGKMNFPIDTNIVNIHT